MGIHTFEDAKRHDGHNIVMVGYGLHDTTATEPRIYNMAIECEDCSEVLKDWDNPAIGGAMCSQCKDCFLLPGENCGECGRPYSRELDDM